MAPPTTTSTGRQPRMAAATPQSLSDLKAVRAANVEKTAAEAPKREKKVDAQNRARTVGRRKEATARVMLAPGSGKIVINGRPFEVYLARPVLRLIVNQPLEMVERTTQYDITVIVAGGGLSGQAGAIRHGITRALCDFEPDLRPKLKAAGFLTRDARTVERKKFGRAKARRRFQFSKR